MFTQIISLPSDLVEGIYTVRAATDDHEVISPPFTVWGTPILVGEEGEGARDEEDGLLAPMPTIPIPEAISTLPHNSGQSVAAASSGSRPLLVLAALGVIGVMAFIMRKVKTRAKK